MNLPLSQNRRLDISGAENGNTFGNERRAFPRFKVRLESPVIIIAMRKGEDKKEHFLPLQGRTQDISRSGIALVISNRDMRELERFGTDCMMRLVLPLSLKAVELEVAPVRFGRLDENLDENETRGVLIGARITNMLGRDRVLFMQFIHECESGAHQ